MGGAWFTATAGCWAATAAGGVAKSFGMSVVAASVVTNLADSSSLSEREPVDGEDVCRTAATAADGMWTIIQNLLQEP